MTYVLVFVLLCATVWISVESTFIKDLHILKEVRSRDEMIRQLRMKLAEKQRLLDAKRLADAKLKVFLEGKQRARNELWLRQRFGKPSQSTMMPSVSQTITGGDKASSGGSLADLPNPNVFRASDIPLGVHTGNVGNGGQTTASSSEPFVSTSPSLPSGSGKNALVKDERKGKNTAGTGRTPPSANDLLTTTPASVSRKSSKHVLVQNDRHGNVTDEADPSTASSSLPLATMSSIVSRGSNRNVIVEDERKAKITGRTGPTTVSSSESLASTSPKVSRESNKDVVKNERNRNVIAFIGQTTISSSRPRPSASQTMSLESSKKVLVQDAGKANITNGNGPTTVSSSEPIVPTSSNVSRVENKNALKPDQRNTKLTVNPDPGSELLVSTTPNASHWSSKIGIAPNENISKVDDGTSPATTTSSQPLVLTSSTGLHSTASMNKANNLEQGRERNNKQTIITGTTTPSNSEPIVSASPNESHSIPGNTRRPIHTGNKNMLEEDTEENANNTVSTSSTTVSNSELSTSSNALHGSTAMNTVGANHRTHSKTMPIVSTSLPVQLKLRTDSITVGNAETQSPSSNQSPNRTKEETNASFSTTAPGHVDSKTSINTMPNKNATRSPTHKDTEGENTTRSSNATTEAITTTNQTDDTLFENQFPIDSTWDPWFDPDFQGPLGAAVLQDVTFGPEANSTTRSTIGDTGSGVQMTLPVTERPRVQSSRNSHAIIAGFLSTLDNWFTSRRN